MSASEQDSLRVKRAHEKRLKRFSHSGGAATATVSFPDQSGRLELPLRRGTESKEWTTYGFPPLATPFSLVIRVTVYRRQGGKVRTPHSGCVLSGAPGYAGTTK